MHLRITQWKRFLEYSRTSQLRTAIMLNYENLGPIPQGIRVKVWHALRFDAMEDQSTVGLNEIIQQSLIELEQEYQIPHTEPTQECFSHLFYFLFNALHSEFTVAHMGEIDMEGLCQLKQCAKWIYHFCWSRQDLVVDRFVTDSDPSLTRIMELFLRETLTSTFIKLLSDSPALLITLFDAFFLFGEDVLFNLCLMLIKEFQDVYQRQADLLRIDSGGILDDMDEIIGEMYVSEVRKELSERLTETVLVGNVDVCQFNAIIFRLQSQLVKEQLQTEEVMEPPVQEFLERSPAPTSKRSSQPVMKMTEQKSARIRATSVSSTSRTPVNKGTLAKTCRLSIRQNTDERSAVMDAIEDIQIFISQHQQRLRNITDIQTYSQEQLKELRLSLQQLKQLCITNIINIDAKTKRKAVPKQTRSIKPLKVSNNSFTKKHSRVM